ncbi:hypothetical protein ACJX0J_018084, partial [Zea mays]
VSYGLHAVPLMMQMENKRSNLKVANKKLLDGATFIHTWITYFYMIYKKKHTYTMYQSDNLCFNPHVSTIYLIPGRNIIGNLKTSVFEYRLLHIYLVQNRLQQIFFLPIYFSNVASYNIMLGYIRWHVRAMFTLVFIFML